MSTLQALIKREAASRESVRIVTVIGDLRMKTMSPSTTAPMWVTDIEFGSGRAMKNVTVQSAGGSMLYARRGASVQLRKSTLGRWQVIGPGDVRSGVMVTKRYNIGSQTQTGDDVSTGFSFRQEPFEFYKGPKAMKGNPVITFADLGGLDTITRDVGNWEDDGFEIGDDVTIQRTVDNDKDDGSPIAVNDVSALVLEFAGNPFIDEVVSDGGDIGIGVVGTGFFEDNGGYPGFPEISLVDADGALA